MAYDSVTELPVVLITGCSGLVGQQLMLSLRGTHHIVGLDRVPPDTLPVGSHFIRCEFTDDESVRHAFGRVRAAGFRHFVSVVHLAHHDLYAESNEIYEDLTVEGTRRVLRELRAFEVEQLVFGSTVQVMKPSSDGQPIDEYSPTEAQGELEESTLRAEALVADASGAIPTVVLRIAGVYDEFGRSPAITERVKRICEKSIAGFFFSGKENHGQSFVHMDDVIDAILRVVNRRDRLGEQEMFLIAEPAPTTYADLQHTLGEAIHGQTWPAIHIPPALANQGSASARRYSGEAAGSLQPWMLDAADQDYPVDISRAQARLGWSPSYRLVDMLPAIVLKMRDDPETWFETNGYAPPEHVQMAARD